MANDVTDTNGRENGGREDTVKSYRGIVWALISVGAFVVILAILALGGFFRSVTDGKPMESPAQIEQKRN